MMNSPGLDHLDIRDLMRTGTTDRVLHLIARKHPADIAMLFKDLEPTEVVKLFDILYSTRRAVNTLKELPPELLREVLALIEDAKIARVIGRADADDAVTFMDCLAAERKERVLALVDPESRGDVRRLESYPRGSVGRLMTTHCLTLPPDMSAQEAIETIRRQGALDDFFYLYIVDAAGKLLGVVPLRSLVIAPPDRRLVDVMTRDPVFADVSMDQEAAARLVSKYDLLALPIVDRQGRFTGIITIDDVIDVLDQENTQDIYRMAGLEEEDRVFTPPMRSVKLRLPWMMFNMITYIPVSLVIGMFEGAIQKTVALAALMPIVAGMGGNGITQTMTVVVRAIALGELHFSSARRALLKELYVNVSVAVVTGILLGLGAFLWRGNPVLGLILALANVINTGLVAGFFGALIPLTLKSLHLDPALGSTIIATTFTDVCGFLSFLSLATVLLSFLA